jgi:putative aldouronate transport system permease protein
VIATRRKTAGDWVIVLLCVLIIAVCLLPVLHIAARSLSSSASLIRNEVTLIPRGLTLDSYRYVLEDGKFTRALWWTAFLTVTGTCLSLFMTTICAYPLTHEKLKGRRVFMVLIIFTMFFQAGIIPTYILLKKIAFLNKPAVLIIPYCLNAFYMIIMKSFFSNVPESLRQSAEIDGAGPIRVLVSIYLPLSTPVIATLALFYAVGRWNGFADALMYMNVREFFPIQLLLYNLIMAITNVDVLNQEGGTAPGLSESLKAAAIMFATVPILLIYPWLQRYFITGATLGAEKG